MRSLPAHLSAQRTSAAEMERSGQKTGWAAAERRAVSQKWLELWAANRTKMVIVYFFTELANLIWICTVSPLLHCKRYYFWFRGCVIVIIVVIISLCDMDDWKLKSTPVVRLERPNKASVLFIRLFEHTFIQGCV